MTILINQSTRVMTQGITGKTGQFHTRKCVDYANGKNLLCCRGKSKKTREKF